MRRFGKSFFVWLISLVFLPLLILGAMEFSLRMVDYGEERPPLRRIRVEGAAYYVPNKAFYQQFSGLPLDALLNWDDLDFQASVIKPDNERRILVLGGSAAYGKRSFARILEAVLSCNRPEDGLYYRVYNFACPGMNSHVMAQIARHLSLLSPDYVVIYMGNNEFIGPYGPTTSLGKLPLLRSTWGVRAHIAVSQLRLFQWIQGESPQQPWHIPDEDALYTAIPRQSTDRRLNRNYKANLTSICKRIRRCGAKVVLCPLAGNPDFGRAPEAMRERDLAPDLSTPINQTILATAKRYQDKGVLLADAARYFEPSTLFQRETVRPKGGYAYFVDNIHFSFWGAWNVAHAVYDALSVSSLPFASPEKRACYAVNLAWSDAAELFDLRDVLGFCIEPFSRRFVEERIASLEGRFKAGEDPVYVARIKKELEGYVAPPFIRDALDIYLDQGDSQKALDLAMRLQAVCPASRLSYRYAGRSYAALGELDKAISILEKGLELYPDDYKSALLLAPLLAGRKDWERAGELYALVLAADPMDTLARCGQADLYLAQGAIDKAQEAYLQVLDFDPQDCFAPPRLQRIAGDHLDLEARLAFWSDLAARYDRSGSVRRCLGDAQSEAGRFQEAEQSYREAIERNSGDPVNHAALGKLLMQEQEPKAAIASFKKALEISPSFSYLLLELAQAEQEAGQIEAARKTLKQALERGVVIPENLENLREDY